MDRITRGSAHGSLLVPVPLSLERGKSKKEVAGDIKDAMRDDAAVVVILAAIPKLRNPE